MKSRLLFTLLILFAANLQAQNVDQILEKYFEAMGGKSKLQNLKGIKMTAKVNQGGMEIPLEIVSLADGRQYTSFSVQGMTGWQNVYDGTSLWSTNFMTMKPEKSDAETTENFKLNIGDFPDPFLNYKAKGYKVELVGKETVDGSETFKLKLTRKPLSVDGKKEDNIAFYYIDTDNYVTLMVEQEIKSGQGKGMVTQTTMSDYQEVDGLLFPFSMAQGVKGMGSQPLVITKIELNPKVENKAFEFPSGN
ncbi:MAG: outer membrane lipoprotein-sorting protein [Cyclobacteriaceae bacterium]|nr:outer membrane lipoprotein-sorting protein [Cyclobacteriaceae bacterium]UYN85203.1 MAG: outer membrane lipoprotein-sorting protein [Cyclobacteriaceae bacterium]